MVWEEFANSLHPFVDFKRPGGLATLLVGETNFDLGQSPATKQQLSG